MAKILENFRVGIIRLMSLIVAVGAPPRTISADGKFSGNDTPKLHFSLIIFCACLLFTVAVWDHYFNSNPPVDRLVVSNLVLLMGTLFSVASGLFVWSLESRRANLEEEVRRRTSELVQKEREEIALYQSSKIIFTTLKLDALFKIVMDLIQKVLCADEGSLMLLDGKDQLYIAASLGIPDHIIKNVHLSMGERVAGRIQQDKKDYLLVGGLENYPNFQGIEGNPRVRSSIVCPLIYQNKVLGVLNLNRTTTAENFTASDLRNASTFAAQVAHGIQNARLYQTLEDKIAELKESNRMLKETQNQLVESEKLASIGRLVAGVAHELNNPLTAVLGYAHLLLNDEMKGKVRDKDKICGQLSIVYREAQRCRQIVQDLLVFARHHEPRREALNPCLLIDEVIDVLKFEFKKGNIEVVRQYPNPQPTIQADPSQLRQVFLNILVNARDALQEISAVRRIDITVLVKNEKTVQFVFVDNGPGIPEKNMNKIFDPFFTTKDVGKGTGIGLSLSYGVVQSHGGSIRVQSEEGKGATFTIELPVGPGLLVSSSPIQSQVESISNGKSQQILIVEDQQSIAGFMEEILIPRGHSIVTALDAETALVKMQERNFDLIICDYHLPKMNGRNLFERAKQSDARLADHFFFITGSSLDEGMSHFFEENKVSCLMKPFTAEDLISTVDSKLHH